MEITKKHWLGAVVGLALAIAAAAAVGLFAPRHADAPQPGVSESSLIETGAATTSESEVAPISATASVSSSRSTVAPPSIIKGDTISSWSFKGVYADSPELVAKADAEIKRLTDLVGRGGEYPDVSIYVGIANQYDLFGDGKQEYDYLVRAISSNGGVSGLPWHNLGVLMEKLGAPLTARVAYQNATLVQPKLKQWHFAYLEFLTTRMKDDVTDIEKAFAAAFANIGQDADILYMQSAWKAS